MAPDCNISCPVTLLPKVPVIAPTIFVKNWVKYKVKLYEEYTEKPVQIIVENAYSLFRPWNMTVTILAVIDTIENCLVQEFNGNSDQSSLVHHWLKPHFHARSVRFVPLTWVGQRCMRVELHGCNKDHILLADLNLDLENGKS